MKNGFGSNMLIIMKHSNGLTFKGVIWVGPNIEVHPIEATSHGIHFSFDFSAERKKGGKCDKYLLECLLIILK